MYILIIVIIIAALFGIGILVSRTKQKPPKESAEARYVKSRISAAQRRVLEAEARLAEWRVLAAKSQATKVEAQVRDATKMGMTRRIWEFIRENPKLCGAVLYVWFSFLGMLYALSYYRSFGIDIFNFSEPLDFLFITFSQADALLTTLFGILTFAIVIIVLLLLILVLILSRRVAWHWSVWGWKVLWHWSVWGWKVLFTDQRTEINGERDQLSNAVKERRDQSLNAAKEKRNQSLTKAREAFFANLKSAIRHLSYVSIVIALIFCSICVPRYEGKRDAQNLVGTQQTSLIDSWISYYYFKLVPDDQKNLPSVRVTIRQDALQPETLLPKPKHTFLLGTTSSFHFFYECENDMMAKVVRAHRWIALPPLVLVRWARPKCEKGRPFIIPTANIASLEFNPSLVDARPKPPATDKKCRLETSHTVTHFPESEHDKLENPKEERLTNLFDYMTRQFKSYRLDRLILTGRVDSNKFNSKEEREFYGTQIELAKARAEWTRGELLKRFPTLLNPQQIALRTAGPRCTDPNGSNCDTALDRSVEVWACWIPKPEVVSSSPQEPTDN